MPAPIAILSFNRPQYLAPVLDSLAAQVPESLAGRAIHLFQDGAVNRYSRLRYADDADIAASVELFRARFPGGHVHDSPDNIGIYENFRRTEDTLFTGADADCVYFFEDDMVLSPHYLAMMQRLEGFARASGQIAAFAAYGDYYASPEANTRRRDQLITLDHHWGFGLLRHHWQAIRAATQGYHALVAGHDYARRDHGAILDHYSAAGGGPLVTSQDAAKAYACTALGLWRMRTVAPFARYIGSVGQHMQPDAYERLGFGRVTMEATSVEDLRIPDPSRIAALVASERTRAAEQFAAEMKARRAAAPARQLNPTREATEEDVRAAAHLLLHRDRTAEEERAGAGLGQPVWAMVRDLMLRPDYALLTHRLRDADTDPAATGQAPARPRRLVNVAFGKPASQSSRSEWSRPDDPAGAVDGVRSGGAGFHTDIEDAPWWQVDLGAAHTVQEIVVYNRCGPVAHRARSLTISVATDVAGPWREVYAAWNVFGGVPDSSPLRLCPDGLPDVRLVRLALRERTYLHLDQVEVYVWQ